MNDKFGKKITSCIYRHASCWRSTKRETDSEDKRLKKGGRARVERYRKRVVENSLGESSQGIIIYSWRFGQQESRTYAGNTDVEFAGISSGGAFTVNPCPPPVLDWQQNTRNLSRRGGR
ncbi:hypothetical protein DFH09DRAFT_1113540 [Mycena vulgaris]|nr:hypothetical protein DFH09DRAFT_1113540 [Mycena vulgaris]